MSRPIGNLEACSEVIFAWVIVGKWEGRKPIVAYRLIKRGKHKGLYRVRLADGRNAWAREVKIDDI